MLFPEEIATERLRLERFCHDAVDVFEYYERFSRREDDIEDVTRFFPRGPHETLQDAKEFVDRVESEWEAGSRAEYVVRPKEGEAGAGEIAGGACLIVDWETQTGKPGIWLRKPFWGRGYSAERAHALIELAFDRLDLDLVAVPVQDGNENSRRAVEKYVEFYGGQYDGVVRNSTTRPDGEIVDHHRYTITREQYENA